MQRIGTILLLLFLSACASPAPDAVAEPVPASQPLPIATDAPKQAELIFIEFFAIT